MPTLALYFRIVPASDVVRNGREKALLGRLTWLGFPQFRRKTRDNKIEFLKLAKYWLSLRKFPV